MRPAASPRRRSPGTRSRSRPLRRATPRPPRPRAARTTRSPFRSPRRDRRSPTLRCSAWRWRQARRLPFGPPCSHSCIRGPESLRRPFILACPMRPWGGQHRSALLNPTRGASMRVRAETTKPAAVQADVLAVPIYRGDREMPPDLAELDAATGGAIGRTLAWGEFNPIEDETALVEVSGIGAARVLLVASGRRGRGAWRARRSASKATRRLQGRGASSLGFWLRYGEGPDAWAAAAIGASQGTYRPYAYYGRVRDTPAMLRSVEEVVLVGAAAPSDGVLRDAMAICDGVEWARELSNRSANDLYPEKMAELARGLEADGCTVEILGPSEMAALGMGALLGGGMGAAHEPRLIAIRLPGWQAGGERRLAIVGKGVCFDSGGISLKAGERMEEMKHDKAGAAG